MSYSMGLLPSGATAPNTTPERGLSGVAFKLTEDGDYDIDGKKLTNVGEATHNTDAVVMSQLCSYFKKDRSNLNDSLNMNTNKITGLAEETHINDAVNKYQMDYKFGDYLRRDGRDSMSGNMDANNHSIINLKNPTQNNEAVNYGTFLKQLLIRIHH